jgi:hypothetical protein
MFTTHEESSVPKDFCSDHSLVATIEVDLAQHRQAT